MAFASGRHALAICDRCGGESRYHTLVPDGYKKGLRVHPWCRDTAHPQEKPFRTNEGIALKHPRPGSDDDTTVITTGTAQAGGASTITLSSTATSLPALLIGHAIAINGGTGNGQSRTISGYVGSTKVATVSVAWTTQPDSTSTYRVTPNLLATALAFTDHFGGGT